MSIYQEKLLGLRSIDRECPFFIMPLFPYVVLKKIINLSYEGLFDEYEYNLGKETAKLLYGLYKATTTKARIVGETLGEFERLGFGKSKVVVFQRNKIILKNTNSPIAKQYAKSFFEDKINVDAYLAGVYSGIASSHFEQNIEIIEKKCQAQLSEECIFTNTERIIQNEQLEKLIKNTLSKLRVDTQKEIKYPQDFSVEMLHRGIYVNKNGIVKMANILHLYSRFGIFTLSNDILSKVIENSEDLHLCMGYALGSAAVKFQRNQFGRKDSNIIFDEVASQLNMAGYGIFSILSRTDDEIVLQFKNALLVRQHLQCMKQFDDPFLKGTLLGHTTAYSKPASSIDFLESKDDVLTIKIQFGKIDFIKELEKRIPQNIRKLAHDRVKHKYYLLM